MPNINCKPILHQTPSIFNQIPPHFIKINAIKLSFARNATYIADIIGQKLRKKGTRLSAFWGFMS